MIAELGPQVARALRDAGYTVEGVEQLLGPVAAAAMHREEIVPARRAVVAGRGEALTDLVAALLLGEPGLSEAVERALGPAGLAGLAALGVWDGERAVADLRPYETGYVVSDFGEMVTGAPLPEDYVLGVGGASQTLAAATVREPVARALDLGTGCGVQAMLLAAHADQVVATDVSQRALEMAGVTLALNGIRNVELRSGSLFEPVTGETFDLIVSNPPFVITPRVGHIPVYEYRDGGMVGDGLVRRVVQGVGQHLNPGGVAQLLGNWEVPVGRRWQDVVAEWLPADLDVWVMQRETLDPARYAEMWLRDAGRDGRYEELYNAWLDDFTARDVTAVGFGLITLRRPRDGAPTLRRLEDVSTTAHQPTGEAVRVGLSAPVVDPATILQVNEDVTQEHYYRPGAADPTVVMLRQGGLLRRALQVSSATAAVVGACDGSLPVGVLIGAVADLVDEDAAVLGGKVLPVLQELAFTGFLQKA